MLTTTERDALTARRHRIAGTQKLDDLEPRAQLQVMLLDALLREDQGERILAAAEAQGGPP